MAAEAKIAKTGFTADTSPTASRVDEIIAEVSAKIDSVISRKYVLPILDPNDLLILRSIATRMCAGRVRETIQVNTGTGKVEASPAAKAMKDAEAELKEIVEGCIKLSASLYTDGDGVLDNNPSSDCVPYFKRGVDQW